MKWPLFFALYFLSACLSAQTITQRLQKAFQQFERDSQLKHAISSLYVIDAKTGQIVFDKNSQIGLAPASTQKIITSVTAFELLGQNYHYKTEFGRYNDLESNQRLWINPSGDPTFGSWRWESTNEKSILNQIINMLIKINGLKKISIIEINGDTRYEHIPDGWIWQDIGNYYGAGAGKLNWRENQFDLLLSSGSTIGDPVYVVTTLPRLYRYPINSEATSAARGTGDNAYIYLPANKPSAIVRGTIPVNETRFKISGSMMNPADQFARTLVDSLNQAFNWKLYPTIFESQLYKKPSIFYTHYSPSLDSIIYWFNKKSVNLYGEALIKTFAYEKQGFGSTDSGVAIVKKFWKEKSLDEDELNIYDGSGLSPLNRVTTHAQVEILKYAKTKDWFPYFLKSLPEYNGMTMKSGTIRDVKGFCGYHNSKDGKEYIFSFLVNNYSGKASLLVGKMYKVLDELK